MTDMTKELVKKHASRLQHLTTNEDIKILAVLLENQRNMLIRQNHLTDVLLTQEEVTVTEELELPKKILDQVVTFYSNFKAKQFVGVQPMMGPVGLAYAMRLMEGADPKAKYMFTREVEGNPEQPVVLTIAVKEVMATTPTVEAEATGEALAKFIDNAVMNHIYKLKEVTYVTKEKLDGELLKYFDKVNKKSLFKVNKLIKNNDELQLGPYKDVDIITIDSMPKNKLVLARKGPNESDAGIVLCPYVPFIINSSTTNFSTRFAICDEFNEIENYTPEYYEVLEYYDVPQENIDNFYKFIKLNLDHNSTCTLRSEDRITMEKIIKKVYKELTNDFSVSIDVANELPLKKQLTVVCNYNDIEKTASELVEELKTLNISKIGLLTGFYEYGTALQFDLKLKFEVNYQN